MAARLESLIGVETKEFDRHYKSGLYWGHLICSRYSRSVVGIIDQYWGQLISKRGIWQMFQCVKI